MASDEDIEVRPDSLPGGPEDASHHGGTGVPHRLPWKVPRVYGWPLLPSAEELAGYRSASRRAPQVIMGEFAAEGRHRRAIEMEIIRGENVRAARAQWFAVVVLIAGLVMGGVLVLSDHDWAGSAIAGGNLVGMAALFLRSGKTRSRRRNDDDRDRLNNE